MINEILSVGRQNATKLDQLLEYAKRGPTDNQLRQEHQRIESLIAGVVARLEEQHKRIEQEIRELYGRAPAEGEQGRSGGISSEKLVVLSTQIGTLGDQLTEVLTTLAKLKSSGGASATSVIAEPSGAMDGVITRLETLAKQVEQIAEQGLGEITLTVDTPTFLEPDYVDMSLIWAQQKASGIHHVVLVADSSATSWNQLGQAYREARAKFPPLILYDVRSKNVVIKTLPQLVVYPKEGEPNVLSGPQEIVDQLSKLARLP